MTSSPSLAAIPPIEIALAQYQLALAAWENESNQSTENALKILTTRETVQRLLDVEKKVPSTILQTLVELDKKLENNAVSLTQILDLAVYRHSLSISPQGWWWSLDETVKEKELAGQLSWLWKGARIGVWTINLGLLGTLATRFFSGASGLGEMLAIALPSILVLLQANNELTSAGREGFNRLCDRLKIPKHLQEEARLIPTVSLFVILLVIWFLQPQFSQGMNQEGRRAQQRGQLTQAEQHYLKAIALSANNLDATYNLGNLYEELQNFDNAVKYYIIAAKGGIPEAYNNLARLYIRQNKYPEAVILLKEGLSLIDTEEQKESPPPPNLGEVKYSLLKNLGWAKLQQSQSEEAQGYLLAAIGIASDPQIQPYIPNPGAAHCLLAQVLELPPQQLSLSLEQWQQCYTLIEKRLAAGEIRNPEEETWFSLAKQKLTSQGNSTP